MQTNFQSELAGQIQTRPEVFTYLDYRQFLIHMTEYLRGRGEYSVRTFARKIGFGSSNYLHLITSGKRSLTGRFVTSVGLGLGLKANELKFFEYLVKLDKAGSLEEKDEILTALMKFKKFREVKRVNLKQYEVFKDWRMVALYEGLGCNWGKKSIDEMAQDLAVSSDVLEVFLRTLEGFDLIERRDGIWTRKDFAVETETHAQAATLRTYHKQMITRAVEAVDQHSSHVRSVGALTLPMTAETYQLIERRLSALRKEIASLYADEKNADVVYQLNIQLFPLLGNPESHSNSPTKDRVKA